MAQSFFLSHSCANCSFTHYYFIIFMSYLYPRFCQYCFVPLFSFVILPFNIVAFVLSYLSLPLANVLFAGYEPLRNWLTEMIFYMQELPWQLWSPCKPSIWLSCVAMLSVLASFYFLEIRRFRKAIMVLVIPAIWVHLSPMLYNETKIAF